ncbi:9833_t:CDS:2 [Acaulospora colombiana]|uniref:9833_t:CDS:1 n=1 Tax=Acaulospora colombiana TaxID=27376 RepID=A0ACA9K266_9GLOM|nr:9833_t:CDS:2 [Acaulospora colombiana]
MMPNMNGFELIKKLRSNTATRLIPVIFLSARAGEEANVKGLEQGADDYLVKPFSEKELIARINVNITFSHLRQKLFLQQKQQSDTSELLFFISEKIRSGFDIGETITIAIEKIMILMPCERIFLVKTDSVNPDLALVMAFSSSDPNEVNPTGRIIPYTFNKNEKFLQKLYQRYNIGNSSEMEGSLKTLQDAFVDHDEYLLKENFYSNKLGRYVSTIAVPIRAKSSLWGWIVSNRPPDKTWSDSEKKKLKNEAQMEAARAANEAKGQILANTSHELRTPLGAIIGVLSAFEGTPLTKDQEDMVQIMTRTSEVVLSVVNNILDAAKLEAQKISLVDKDFALLHVVEETISIIGERAGAKQLELILCYEYKSLPNYIKSDPDSVKFTETGEIILKVSMASDKFVTGENDVKENCTLYVELTDTGIGIDPEFMKHMWESFSQADASITRRQDGTGLGLSICKHLVTMNGGQIGATSELGKGSRFWFTWNFEPLQPMSFNLPFSPTIRSKRVLVIDPVDAARSALVRFLSDHVKQVRAFNTIENGVTSAKPWKEHNELYDLAFFNIHKDNVYDIRKAANELRSLCGDHMRIVLMAFWSTKGRILGEEIMKEVGGRITTLYKPIMHKRILDCLHDIENFNSTSNKLHAHSIIKSEEYYQPSTRISEEKDLSTRINANNTEVTAMLIDGEDRVDQVRTPDNSSGSLKRISLADGKTLDDHGHVLKSRTRPTSRSKCVLCVEDNPINLKVLQHQLTKLGYQSISATNGQEAVDLITDFTTHSNNEGSSSSPHSSHHEKISLILMDCAMPVMSGFDASKVIRAMESSMSQIPIIALTASAIQGSKEKCLESGMNDFLTSH